MSKYLTTERTKNSGITISTKSVCWELHGFGFGGRTAAGVMCLWPSTFFPFQCLSIELFSDTLTKFIAEQQVVCNKCLSLWC